MRDAESALDQLISFCGEKIVESDVLSMFGLAAQGQIIAITDAILNGDAQSVLRELETLAKHGKDLARLLADLLGHFRDLLIHQVGGGAGLELGEAEAAAIQRQSALIKVDALTRIMEVLTDAEGGLRDAASKKIFVEVALLRAIEGRNAVSIDALLKQLQALRSGEPTGTAPAAPRPAEKRPVAATPAPATAPTRAVPATPATAAPVTAALASSADLQPLWQQLLEAVGRASTFTRSYLADA